MPYIKREQRNRLAENGRVEDSGELNYSITRLLVDYVLNHKLSYKTCNDIVGALDNAKDEFQRRIQHPYEDKKINENGDVYPNQV